MTARGNAGIRPRRRRRAGEQAPEARTPKLVPAEEAGAGDAAGEARPREVPVRGETPPRLAPVSGAAAAGPEAGTDAGPPPTPGIRRFTSFSSLTLRILAINVLALAILLVGLLYLDEYRDGLIEAKVAALTSQAEIIAGALGERAVTGEPEALELDPELARQLIGRLVVPTRTRARLFGTDGSLLGDSRELRFAGREVQSSVLPPPQGANRLVRFSGRVYDWIVDRLPRDKSLPLYNEAPDQMAEDYRETADALAGETGSALRVGARGHLVISVAVPVQQFKRVLGALMLSAGDEDIRASVREGRFAILQVFLLALAITVLLSLFLAGTIARPVRRLAAAARKVRHGHGGRVTIPDFSGRRDEIGDLSGALADMTETLYRRLDDIERFAADVAHEIKNPLTSLHSAAESFTRVQNPEQRERLIAIMEDDVARLDRLITDISDASRLDAELSRAEIVPVDLGRLLDTTVDIYRTSEAAGRHQLDLEIDDGERLVVDGIEDRLGQVVRNLLANAMSFSPPEGAIHIRVAREGSEVVFSLDDEGPGIPEESLEAVFQRFYTLRPADEIFGTHSGLGLSISRQIVEAHGGTIAAMNLRDASGRVSGTRFTVRLPA